MRSCWKVLNQEGNDIYPWNIRAISQSGHSSRLLYFFSIENFLALFHIIQTSRYFVNLFSLIWMFLFYCFFLTGKCKINGYHPWLDVFCVVGTYVSYSTLFERILVFVVCLTYRLYFQDSNGERHLNWRQFFFFTFQNRYKRVFNQNR